MANKTALTIIVSIILTIILVSLVNVGTSIVVEEPEYNDFCKPQVYESNLTEEKAAELSQEQENCYDRYNDAMKPYNQYRYYIFAGIGFILLLTGLFAKENMVQLTGLAAGGILVFEGIVTNWQNKVIVFFSLLAILAIFGIVAWRVINKK